jgi:2,4-didehydro-3-deoxy-L-rhamnonate hydrolase
MGVLRPPLTIPEPDEFALLDWLNLRLSVNDVVRWDITASLVFKAAETISELSTLAEHRAQRRASRRNAKLLRPESSTGGPTPARLAARASLLRSFPAFAEPEYLKPRDILRATIRGADARIDLASR